MKKTIGIFVGITVLVTLGFSVFQRTTNDVTPTTPTPTASIKRYATPPAMSIDVSKKYTAIIQTPKGAMRVNLFAAETPVTVNNFIFLAREGFYTGTPFHRIIKGFMIQGGDPTGTGTGSPGYRFDDEAVVGEYTRGTIAMANSGPNTNGSQFFIMHADYALPKDYVIFGSIAASDNVSLQTLDAIASVPVGLSPGGEQSMPQEPVFIQSVTIDQKE